YDLVVVGAGTAAMGAAMRVRKAGWSVAVIDFRPFGGTCALRGCDPKKVLVAGAETVDLALRMRTHGTAGETRIDWPELMAFKRRFTDPIPASTEEHYVKNGIDPLHGRARFTGRTTMEVDGTAIEGRHFLLAAGAEPVKLAIPGEAHVVTHEEFLSLERLPRRIALVGGGYIAAEFSHIAARAGAKVRILQRGERMLPRFDPDLVDLLMDKFRAVGIEVRTRTRVEAVEKTQNGFAVRASSAGQSIQLEADLVVHAAGRKPDLEALNLGAANVAVKNGKLELNEYLQSMSNPAVYAAGDTAQMGPPLTPVSSHDAKVVAANLLEGNHRKPDYSGVPSVAFTVPPIAALGMSESEARERGLKYRKNYRKASDWYTARRVAEAVYGFKVLVEEGTDRLLGAHLVGPHADEVINIFALAIRKGLTAEDLRATMFAYPTGASDIGYMV
ncbi:MAG: dihydrolipoyl dehydrogenase family protein, partial [Burkholderiales bacterium]